MRVNIDNMTSLDHEEIARTCRLASGKWIEARRDTSTRINSTLGHWRRNIGKRPRAFTDRYEFRMQTCGYGTGLSKLMVRHVPVTFPLDSPTHPMR